MGIKLEMVETRRREKEESGEEIDSEVITEKIARDLWKSNKIGY